MAQSRKANSVMKCNFDWPVKKVMDATAFRPLNLRYSKLHFIPESA
jgi:hypothetical protein